MPLFRNRNDTICALATPPGFGGIAVIRVSGKDAYFITKKFCAFLPEQYESHRVYYGFFSDVDEVMVTYFEEGRSFTGDHTCEISCHGSPTVTKLILQMLIQLGCRIAEKGEFTYRAFMSGRIDLIQAESVLSLIQSESVRAHDVALRQLKGDLSKKILELENKVIFILANFEASIDFVNENLEVLDIAKTKEELEQILNEVKNLTKTFQKTKFLYKGAQAVIVGRPNVGKSSLFNTLIKKERALVSPNPGTTRDVVESSTIICDAKVTFFDTAGIHNTKDQVEQMGIEKSFLEIKDADFILYVLDQSAQGDQLDIDILGKCKDKPIIFIANKADLSESEDFINYLKNQIKETYKGENIQIVSTSVPNNTGFDELVAAIERNLKNVFLETSEVIIQNRHYELLKKIEIHIQQCLTEIGRSSSPDILASDLKEAYFCFNELNGKKIDDEIMDRVFKEFCIGK